jgi:hypothetical protein
VLNSYILFRKKSVFKGLRCEIIESFADIVSNVSGTKNHQLECKDSDEWWVGTSIDLEGGSPLPVSRH